MLNTVMFSTDSNRNNRSKKASDFACTGYLDYMAVNDDAPSQNASIMYGSFVMDENTARAISAQYNRFANIFVNRRRYLGGWFNKSTTEMYTYKNGDGIVHMVLRRRQRINQDSTNMVLYPVFLDIDQENFSLQSYLDYVKLPQGIIDGVYDAIDKNTAVPMLKEWAPYVANELRKIHGISKCLIEFDADDDGKEKRYHGFRSVVSISFFANRITDIISEGLRHGDISVDGCNAISNSVNLITGMDSYQNAFGQQLAEKTKENFKPKFDPSEQAVSQKVKDFYDVCHYYAPRIHAYTVQENVIQAAVNNLNKNQNVLISGQTGSGKTQMAIGTIVSHAHKRNFSVLVMVPSQMVTSWYDSIREVVPMADVRVVTNLSEFIQATKAINNPLRVRSLWVVLSDNTAKATYDEHPAVVWDKVKKTYVCPHCGRVIQFETNRDRFGNAGHYSSRLHNADDMDFFKANENNLTCKLVRDSEGNSIKGCGEKLWEASVKVVDKDDVKDGEIWNTHNSRDWVKLDKVGWVQKTHIAQLKQSVKYYVDNLSDNAPKRMKKDYDKVLKAISDYEMHGAMARYPRSYSIANYIRKHMKRNSFDYGCFDEVHELASDSIQGNAFGNITNSVWKSVFLTGTVSNGLASGLFYLLFRTQTKRMLDDGFTHKDISAFVEKYGVKEIVTTESGYYTRKRDGSPNFWARHRKTQKRNLPGISPTLFVDYLMDNTVFVAKKDIREDLCQYTEVPVAVPMDIDQTEAYQEIMTGVTNEIGNVRGGNRRVVRNAVLKSTMFLDQPYGLDTRRDNGTMIELSPESRFSKEQKLVDICKKHVENGEKMLVYCEYTAKLDIINRLKDILLKEGIRAVGMDSSIKLSERQKWLEDGAKEDRFDVVILNPAMVGTGLNLLDYTAIVFYEVGTKLTTVRQASQRSNRINQTKPVTVYFMYYEGTVQEDELALISQKLKAAKALEGDFSESAIQDMTDDTDIMTKMANLIVKNEHIKVDASYFEGNTEDTENVDGAMIDAEEKPDMPCFADRPMFDYAEAPKTLDMFDAA